MAARRNRHTKVNLDAHLETAGASRWMVSYSDFMTLLFVVFMVLFSAARVDSAKYAAIAEAFQQYVGRVEAAGGGLAPLPPGGGSAAGEAAPIIPGEGNGDELPEPDWVAELVEPLEEQPSTPQETSSTENVTATQSESTVTTQGTGTSGSTGISGSESDSMSDLAEAFQGLPGARSGILSVALQERGLVISIAGSVLFDTGEVSLKPSAAAYLDEVAQKLYGVELPIMVEGTADREGVSSGTYTSWDLAALRASAVVNYFVQHHGIPGSRFVTIGYGSAQAADRPPDMVTIVVLRKAS